MDAEFACEDGDEGRYKHGDGKVEAADEGVIPRGRFRKALFRQIVREVDAIRLCTVISESTAMSTVELTETAPQVKQLIVKHAATQTQPYPPSSVASSQLSCPSAPSFS